jgi:hypothetical protein
MKSSPRAEDLTFDELKEYWRGFRSKNIFFTYARCTQCGLVYCPKYFSGEQLNDLYSSMEDNTAGEKLHVLNDTQRSYVEILADKTEVSDDWLELGGDIGLLTKHLFDLPGVKNVSVIEPNISVHSDLLKLIDGRGTTAANWSDLPPTERFNGVVGVHVLDHLLDLSGELERIKACLNNGGSAFFVTHDESSLLRKFLKSKWPPFCLQHPQLFSPKSIANVLERKGFGSVDVTKTHNKFTLRHIAEVATNVMGFGSLIAKLIPPVAIRLKLGNIATLSRLNS